MYNPRFEQVIWDADGVLIDSRLAAWKAARDIVGLFHSNIKVESREDYLRHFSSESQRTLVGEEESKTLRAMHRLLMRHRWRESQVFNEVIEIVQALVVPSIIVTSAFSNGIRRILDPNDRLFVDILGREEGRKSTLLPRAMSATSSVCVTDSAKDIETCRTLKLNTVGIGWGYYSFDEIESATPTFSAKTPAELRKLFAELYLIA